MSVAFYMDHHVKAAVTDGLRRRGVDVMTCLADGTDREEDEQVLQRATELGRVVFTQDDDFLSLADEWLEHGRDFAGVIYAHQLGITIGQSIRDLELVAKVLEPDEMRNRIVFLPYAQPKTAQDRVRREQNSDFFEHLSAEDSTLDRKPLPLVVVEQETVLPKLLSEHPVSIASCPIAIWLIAVLLQDSGWVAHCRQQMRAVHSRGTSPPGPGRLFCGTRFVVYHETPQIPSQVAMFCHSLHGLHDLLNSL